MKRWAGLGLLLGVLAASSFGIALFRVKAQEPKVSDAVVHEWGTFLAMNGSDGIGLEGMYHEEHALPGFVHARSRDQLRLPSVVIKGETPVIYFYTDRPQKTRVDVRFPKGIWTQWYPQAQIVGPQFTQTPSATDLRDGRIRWCADIIPADTPGISLPQTSDDALWNFARDVDAAYVRTPDNTRPPNRTEIERFLFYRGLGRASLPLEFTAADDGTLSLPASDRFGIAHVFVLRVGGDKGSYSYRPALWPGEKVAGVIPSESSARPLAQFASELSDELAARLVECGLYAKEARAMVNTWRTSYFQTPGVRVLFVMPQAWTDEFIPLTIAPTPRATVRVMVGRTELLTPERERLAEEAIGNLASPDSAVRQRAFAVLQDQGRYVEPIVRRVLKTSTNQRVTDICRQLLSAEFVTELKAALKNAEKDRNQRADDPVFVRAQLALLLREVGLNSEATAEGNAVLNLLAKMPAPAISHSDYRAYSRAHARAMESVGDIKGASDWYDRFVVFGSQAMNRNDCRFCHRDAGPENAAWFRSWWAGPRYASHVAKVEGLDQAILRLEKSPTTPASSLRLAYLLEARGDTSRAKVLWNDLEKGASTRLANAEPRR
jgi:hypothetical protein